MLKLLDQLQHQLQDYISLKIYYKKLEIGCTCCIYNFTADSAFRPVSVDNIDEHEMHSEYYQMSEDTAELLNKVKADGKKIISVGTTSTRTLETIRSRNDKFIAESGWTDIFIYPGYEFKAIDGLITISIAKSTLIMLVSAHRAKIFFNAYRHAVESEYDSLVLRMQ